MAVARRPLPNLQPLLLGVGFALLIVISATTVWLVDRAASDAKAIADTLARQDRFSNVLLTLRRAESSQRGYLFTNDLNYLKEYTGTEPQTQATLDALRTLTKGNPAQQARVAQIASMVDAKFKEMGDTIRLNENGQRDAARKLVLGGSGRDMMDDLRTLIESAVHTDEQLIAERSAQSQRTSRMLLYATLAGAALIVLIGALSILLVQRNAREREAARAEIADTNANLEQIVAYRTADLTEANEEIQRFAYIVSHDLRSPLVNIMGFTSELEALRQDIFAQVAKLSADLATLNAQAAAAEGTPLEQLGKDFDEAIGFIKSSIANMDRLINAVLKLSREGRRQFNPERVDVNSLLKSIADTVAHRAAELGATMQLGDLPLVESDRLALEQVFANLVDNALKYGRPEEPPRIEISGRTTATHSIYEVKDNGRGIDPRDHQRVFELFRRSGPQDRPGEGIGLAHVRALVRRLGGTMGLASEPGKGSTFTVTLPRRWSVQQRSYA